MDRASNLDSAFISRTTNNPGAGKVSSTLLQEYHSDLAQLQKTTHVRYSKGLRLRIIYMAAKL